MKRGREEAGGKETAITLKKMKEGPKKCHAILLHAAITGKMLEHGTGKCV